jgi:hypothetical protein
MTPGEGASALSDLAIDALPFWHFSSQEQLSASRLENALDDLAGMHLFERLPPLCQGRDAV